MFCLPYELIDWIRQAERLKVIHADRAMLQSFGLNAEEVERYQQVVGGIEVRLAALVKRRAR